MAGLFKSIKENYKFLLFVFITAIIGGFATGKYLIENYTEDILDEAVKQLGSEYMLIVIAMIQTIAYGVILGILGVYLSKKVGLWRKIKFDKKNAIVALIYGVIGGLLLILSDVFWFNNTSSELLALYSTKPSISCFISSFLYGGVIEEVMMRLFLMSLVIFIIAKIIYRKNKEKNIQTWIYVLSNIIVAILFAAGHIPTTIAMLGITPVLLVRCFLLNGIPGLLFGRLYRKCGIQYAMIAHFVLHLVSKILWIILL